MSLFKNKGLFNKTENVLSESKSQKIVLPSNYEIINKQMPTGYGYPEDAVDYRMINDSTYAYLLTYQVTEEESIPFDNMNAVIAEMRGYLDENTGLIEVKNGITKNNGKYVYILKKMLKEPTPQLPSQMMYMINMNIQIGNTNQFINATFEEIGSTGMREAVVMEIATREGRVGRKMKGWTCDPYDPKYNKGFLMNISEEEKYDQMFLHHPLTEARRLAKFVAGSN